MKKFVPKRAVGAVLAGLMLVSPAPLVNLDLNVFAEKTLQTSPSSTRDEGWYNGYHHEIWQADTPNSSTMTLHDNDGGFKTTWKCGPNNSKGNFLARRGLYYGLNNPKTWKDYEGFTCDYDCTWSAGSSGNSRICIYGWAQNPLVEYYIIEDWKNWSPAQDPTANYKGSVTIDGSEYKVYTSNRNSYTIEGNKNFTQYISIRQKTRTNGTISISEHFKAWESMGMKMGNFYECAFNVEGWESDGTADVNLTIKEGKTSGGGQTDPDPTIPDPDANGDYFTSTFESGKDNWTGRGDASVSIDSKNFYQGSKSLYVTGRTKEWNGAAINLSTSTFVPGNSYSFSTGVLQKSGSATTMKLTLQYTDASGKTQYDEVDSVKANSGEWTKLENKSFTIPSGASDLILYVEAPDSLTNFYIDNAAGSKAGKASSVTTGKGTVDSSNQQSNPDTTDAALKNVFSSYFKVGTAVSSNEVQKNPDFIRKHFNSITPENELKPQYILDQNASKQKGNNVNPQVTLPYSAKIILDFAVKYNIPVRGHTFIWHSQTPDWFFKENFDSNGAVVSKEVMDQRMENFIKNTFTMLKENYPTLNLYAYDVVNEAFDPGNGNLRQAGFSERDGQSPYMTIYGDDSYMQKAFAYARKYAPQGCKLFYNDFNEYNDGKVTAIYNFAKKVHEAGNLDGIGMQSHLGTNYPDATRYKNALNLFSSIPGLEIHVTELDVMQKGASSSGFANYYAGIVQDILDCDAVTSLTWWGTNDGMSWRKSDTPLLFDENYQPKEAFKSVVSLVPTELWGKTNGNEQPDPDLPKYPTTKLDGIQGNAFRISWNKLDNADKYVVAYTTNGKKWKIAKTVDKNTTSLTYKNVPKGTYYVVVGAYVNGKIDTSDLTKRAVKVTIG
ncbi:endo-1,4-beta-xylanase [Ruminococcus sp. YE71]|uniref:endo-1,4-beta-xylanase n=1 Tax=unclassified Ruminococcus TaxID=2608920 RepID=UPI0008908CBB|nr:MULTISPECIES: endo-1,4-beta-xylanase [unclassified Ruminococcus]SDA26532.1 endo-1,4-beta-xylanase [Ruminococcus sp. YE78]SFW44190.1 endo-1,4-beta-xylanase [Ruminococcus sp. YE71]